MPVTIDERLVELDYGIWDGLTWEEVGRLDLAGRQAWLQDGVSYAPHGGETMTAVAARVGAALQEWRATINPEVGAVVAVLNGNGHACPPHLIRWVQILSSPKHAKARGYYYPL